MCNSPSPPPPHSSCFLLSPLPDLSSLIHPQNLWPPVHRPHPPPPLASGVSGVSGVSAAPSRSVSVDSSARLMRVFLCGHVIRDARSESVCQLMQSRENIRGALGKTEKKHPPLRPTTPSLLGSFFFLFLDFFLFCSGSCEEATSGQVHLARSKRP